MKSRSYAIAAGVALLPILFMFTNTSYNDETDQWQIVVEGIAHQDWYSSWSESLWYFDYNFSYSSAEPQFESSGGGSTEPETQIVVVGNKTCQEEKESVMTYLDQNSTDSRKVFIAENHDTFNHIDYGAIMDKLGAVRGDCVAMEGPNKDTVHENYQAIAETLEAKGLSVHWVDQQYDKYTWNTEGTDINAFNMMNIRDQGMSYRISLMQSVCRRTFGIFGAEHLLHEKDPAEWTDGRINLWDSHQDATVIDIQVPACL